MFFHFILPRWTDDALVDVSLTHLTLEHISQSMNIGWDAVKAMLEAVNVTELILFEVDCRDQELRPGCRYRLSAGCIERDRARALCWGALFYAPPRGCGKGKAPSRTAASASIYFGSPPQYAGGGQNIGQFSALGLSCDVPHVSMEAGFGMASMKELCTQRQLGAGRISYAVLHFCYIILLTTLIPFTGVLVLMLNKGHLPDLRRLACSGLDRVAVRNGLETIREAVHEAYKRHRSLRIAGTASRVEIARANTARLDGSLDHYVAGVPDPVDESGVRPWMES
ncbi:hypothetical protein C8R44DRAFT_726439 [Mycena epipterygia]|nr:hypothetical protein C8R44DRAFT_726439 [Mycena epipterygia]